MAGSAERVSTAVAYVCEKPSPTSVTSSATSATGRLSTGS